MTGPLTWPSLLNGRVVGQQEISGRDYRILREVSTFSWLGLRYQG